MSGRRSQDWRREFPEYLPRVLTSRRILLTTGQIDEIDELIEGIAVTAREIRDKRGEAELRAFSELVANRTRLREILHSIRTVMRDPSA